MTRLRIGHCKATRGHIVSRGPPAVCHHCGSTLSREHILLECGTVQELRGEFYEADSLTSLFECVRPLTIIEYPKEAGFFYLIWRVYESEIRNVKSHKPQNPDSHIIEDDKWIAENIRKKCRTANMSWRTCVVVKQIQFHSIPLAIVFLIDGPANYAGQDAHVHKQRCFIRLCCKDVLDRVVKKCLYCLPLSGSHCPSNTVLSSVKDVMTDQNAHDDVMISKRFPHHWP